MKKNQKKNQVKVKTKKPASKKKENLAIVKMKNQVKKLNAQLQKMKTSSGECSLVKSPLEEKQILRILQKTPPNHIFKRPAKGGGEWEYVTGTYIKKVLNYTFGWLWDSEVTDHGVIKNADGKIIQIWVMVKLTIKRLDKNGIPIPAIVKTQIGGKDVAYKRSAPMIPLDYANDMKSAITDGIKKCASELGIASDIYGKNEFKDIEKEPEPEKKKPIDVTPPSGINDSLNYVIAGLNIHGWSRENTNRVIAKNFSGKSKQEDLNEQEKIKLLKMLDDNLEKLEKKEKKKDKK